MSKRLLESAPVDCKRSADDPLYSVVLREECRSSESRLSTLPLDVLRYVLQPMIACVPGSVTATVLSNHMPAAVKPTWTRPQQIAIMQDGRLLLCYNSGEMVLLASDCTSEVCRFTTRILHPDRVLGTPHNQVAVNSGNEVVVYSDDGRELFHIKPPRFARDMAIDIDGCFYLLDTLSYCVAVYSSDGEPMRRFGYHFDKRCAARFIGVYRNCVVLSDIEVGRLYVYSLYGQALREITIDRLPRLYKAAMCVDRDGRIVTLDQLDTTGEHISFFAEQPTITVHSAHGEVLASYNHDVHSALAIDYCGRLVCDSSDEASGYLQLLH